MGRSAGSAPAAVVSPQRTMSPPPHHQRHHEQHQQQLQFASFRSRAAAARSRFQEGSMNDRVSAAPPADFLGDDYTPSPSGTVTAASSLSSRSSWAGPATAASDWGTTNVPPGSSCSAGSNPNRHSAPSCEQQQQQQQQQQPKQKSSGFFAPLWDGMRERLRLTRSKSSINVVNPSPKDAAPASRPPVPPLQQTQSFPPAAAAATPSAAPHAAFAAAGPPGGPRPTREEVLQSYQQLMKSGFFDSHAIQSSRHAPPPGMTSSRPSSRNAPPNLAPVTEHSPAPGHRRNVLSTSATSGGFPRPRKRSGGFVAAVSRGYFSECEDDDEDMVDRDAEPRRPSTSYGRRRGDSLSRGTKRHRADAESMTSSTTASDNPARRLVKKLRKSTSRLSNRRNSDAAADAVAAVAAALRSSSNVNAGQSSPRKSGGNGGSGGGGGPPLSHRNNNCLYQQVEPVVHRKLTKTPSKKDLQDLERQSSRESGSLRRRGGGGAPPSAHATGVSNRPGSSYGGHGTATGLAPPPIGHMLRGASAPPRTRDNAAAAKRSVASPPPLPAPSSPQKQSSHHSHGHGHHHNRSHHSSASASPTRTAPASPVKDTTSVRAVAAPSFHYPQRVRRPGIQHQHHQSAGGGGGGGPLASLSPEDRRANRAPSHVVVAHVPIDLKTGVNDVIMVGSVDGIENRRGGWA
ncbi:hypothetical protein GGTG_13014 [Gaeumannomyces tritici R3-111a-1]|uniref:Uncharacterized protein n=1 Tax=Gaeumannomyces tritici (strain R3-111a-1) TaxID=644352 RepID=J3PHN4_GAET3|nr:hypothetical protein GGTG_13014 [Gaeumannomyces tritici R3-111a-1]EJT69395.1 hypothetical protein GGTG_13014 [Gaeumannomyces tritici R3-111a-1]